MAIQAAGQSSPHGPVVPQNDPKGDLTSVSLEDLMNLEVTSVSKKQQKLSRTAAVFVITQKDMQRSGATNIPDVLRMVLRMVPGIEVAQINASTWAISARGFERGIRQRASGDDGRAQRLHAFVRRRVLGGPRFAVENIERSK